MAINSWMILEAETDSHALSTALRAQDGFHGRDIGWVAQMRPFVREFSKPGETVLDPFAGLGTTLLAAELEGRRSVGIEIESARVELIRQRWMENGFANDQLTLEHGDCVSMLSKMPDSSVDLCLTSVPYFGSQWRGSEQTAQLYATNSYEHYLRHLQRMLLQLRRVIRTDGHLVLMAENVRTPDRRFLPVAWDLGKLMSSYFSAYDERVLLYRKESAPADGPNLHTNRAHEYALIAKNEESHIERHVGEEWLLHLQGLGVPFCIYGSYAKLCRGESARPRDLDLLLPDTPLAWTKTMEAMKSLGFQLHSWDEPISGTLSDPSAETWRNRRYIRCLSASTIRQVDLVFIEPSAFDALPRVNSPLPVAARDIAFDENWLPIK